MPIQSLLDVERFLLNFKIDVSQYSFNYVKNTLLPYYEEIVEKQIEERKEKEALAKNEALQKRNAALLNKSGVGNGIR